MVRALNSLWEIQQKPGVTESLLPNHLFRACIGWCWDFPRVLVFMISRPASTFTLTKWFVSIKFVICINLNIYLNLQTYSDLQSIY